MLGRWSSWWRVGRGRSGWFGELLSCWGLWLGALGSGSGCGHVLGQRSCLLGIGRVRMLLWG